MRASRPSSKVTTPKRHPRWSAAASGGFTLIEVMVSALIVILISGAAAKALISTSQFSGDQRFRAEADGLATQDQERMRGLSDEQLGELDAASQARTEVANGQSFSVKSTAAYVDTTGGSSCTSSAAAYYKVSSTVSWIESSQSQPVSVTEDSLLARPVTGFLLTDAQDQTLTPLPGVTINATGPDTQVGTTDANGCQLFAALDPGSYTVTLTDPGYVDYFGNSTLTGTATVTLTGTTKTTGDVFTMGLAGSIAASFNTAAGVGAEADGVSWSGNGGIGQPVTGVAPAAAAPATAPASATTTQSTTSLFPFNTNPAGAASYNNNYTVWPGRCAQQQPPTPTQVSVSPGQLNQAVPLTENELILNSVTYKNGTTTTTVKPSDVKLTFTGGSCSDTWTPTLTTASTMPATGWLANPGQPYAASGTLSMCVDYTASTTSPFYSKTTVTGLGNASTVNTLSTVAITKGSTSSKC